MRFSISHIWRILPDIRRLHYSRLNSIPPVIDLTGISNRLSGKHISGELLNLSGLPAHVELGDYHDDDKNRDHDPAEK